MKRRAPAVASGRAARVIMQFATAADRDAAFNGCSIAAPRFAPRIRKSGPRWW